MVPHNVAEIIREHVTLEVQCIDRMHLNAYVPSRQTGGGFVHFVRNHLGFPIASTAVIAPQSDRFVRTIEAFAKAHHLELMTFEKDQRKDYLARCPFTEGVLFIGKAQGEKARVLWTIHKRNPETGKSYPWISRGCALPSHYYFYLVDDDFGPLFIKFCSYFPYAAKVCINGHEWVKRQLSNEGIAFAALDNGVLSCENPAHLPDRRVRLAWLKTLVMLEAIREINGVASTERHYYISSQPTDGKRMGTIVRGAVGRGENGLHWSLDVVFGEDQARMRDGNAAENFSILRRIALKLLR